ncbi:MAG: radical SAM protein [Telmatospirillum sp.]|nr:radical SAM protein [Telmatospirillum sp.]
MRVLFSNPPWWQEVRDVVGADGRTYPVQMSGVRAGSRWPHTRMSPRTPDNFIFGAYLPYPFFMGYAATYLAKMAGVDVTFHDSIALAESYQSYFRFIKYGNFDYIFIESATPSWDHDGRLIRKIHAYAPNAKIVLTGPIAANGAKILENFPIHAVIRGEYEKGSVNVVNGKSGLIDFDLLTTEEMNLAPFPYFDELHAHRYFDSSPRGQIAPHAQVWASRGCPYKCIFCVWPATMTGNDPDGAGKRTARFYSADYMEAYLTELVKKYNFKSIYFDDDTFNLTDAHVERICGVMRKLNLPWAAMCRADTIKMDTWRIMKESGCFGVKLGFESGNQEVVDKIVNKRLNIAKASDVVYELKKLGMTVHGTFTIGLPGETEEQMEDTKRLIRTLPFDTHQLSGCAEIEGTPLASLAQRGHLDRYAGARLDAGYVRNSDGARKIDEIASLPQTEALSSSGSRLIYLDATLRYHGGHHANSCRHIVGEARRRGIATFVVGSARMEKGLAEELGGEPLFRHEAIHTISDDPLCGWMENFFFFSDAIFQDLQKLGAIGHKDIIYWNSARPGELMALINWMQSKFTPETCPRVVVEFGYPPGLLHRRTPDGKDCIVQAHGDAILGRYANDPQLYRFAARRLRPEFRRHLILGTFDPSSSWDYSQLLELPVAAYPLPQPIDRPVRLRSADKPVVVSFLGHQRPDKGYHLLPEIVPRLLANHPGVQILIHNGNVNGYLEQTAELMAIGVSNPRFILKNEIANGEAWQSLLDQSSLIVLPYQPERYANSYSAILSEAISQGIPLVVPGESCLGRLVREYGDCGICFDEWTPSAVCAAVAEALDDFSNLARRALDGAKLWAAEHGPRFTVDAILGDGRASTELGGRAAE